MVSSAIPEESSFHHPLEEEEEEEEDDQRRPGETIVLAADDDDDEEEEDDFDPSTPNLKVKHKTKKGRTSMNGNPKVPPSSAKRRRRRSSARFLRLSPDEEQDVNDDFDTTINGTNTTTVENLGEVYRKAIRMNAENRINATNSWNLNLIDHLDRFIAPELRSTNMASTLEDTLSGATGVNFTKASCTLDASVKIYSYRVDDVHLTSYKVLANLNRTDNGNKKKNMDSDAVDDDIDGDHADSGKRRNNKGGNSNGSSGDTLEHNLANINVHKLDAAFDVDPLFHKMSKTFDEGGAKGLLLANLGVSHQPTKGGGCKIVFDSTLDEEECSQQIEQVDVVEKSNNDDLNAVDVSSLVSKLEALVAAAATAAGQPALSIRDMPLVPQLMSLRQEYTTLDQDGFVDQNIVSSNRYATSHEEEAEADRSIHIEAIERSRASQADLGRSLLAQDDSGSDQDRDSFGIGRDEYAPDDFGGGGDDFDDGYDVSGFGDFHDGDHRFSSSSFQAAASSDGGTDSNNNVSTQNQQSQLQPPCSQASILLDAIASGDISTSLSNNPYEYFNSQALANLSSGNMWAGADHWKKLSKRRKNTTVADKDNDNGNERSISKKKKGRKAKSSDATSRSILVDITKPVENLQEMLQKPKTGKRGGSASASDKLQWSKAMQTKYDCEDNLLPLDAQLNVNQLTTLFLRPNVNLAEINGQRLAGNGLHSTPKTVGFGGVETWGGSGGGYSDDDDDGGLGYDFGGGQDGDDDVSGYVIPELDGIRKVEKIKVGYATVAKKVDVKKLKRDLWMELENTFKKRGYDVGIEGDDDDVGIREPDSDPLEENIQNNFDSHTSKKQDIIKEPLSFQSTLLDMQTTQSQADVTLPFYFICILHLCNEKGLALESCGLDDFVIHSS